MIEQPAGLKSFSNTYEIDFLFGFIFKRFSNEGNFEVYKTKRVCIS
jgi:hypothetical protein